MATGGQLTILNPNDQTNLDFPHISPIDGNIAVIENNDKGLTLDQAILKDVYSIIEILIRPNKTIAKKKWVHGMIQEMSYSLNMQTQINKQHNSDPIFDNVHNSSISGCTDIKQTVDNSDIGDPNEPKTETINDTMQNQANKIDSEDQGILVIESPDTLDSPIDNDPIKIKDILPVVDNNTQDFNSPIDFNDHNSSMVTQAETNNSHKESKPIESEDESDPKSFESGNNLVIFFKKPWDSNTNVTFENEHLSRKDWNSFKTPNNKPFSHCRIAFDQVQY